MIKTQLHGFNQWLYKTENQNSTSHSRQISQSSSHPPLFNLIIQLFAMKQIFAALVLFAASVQLVNGMQNLDLKYPFSDYLDDTFKLYWDFDMKQQKIDFAVNVSTNGWIGFGISPNGRMLQSDIVMGWVNGDGTAQFHVS